MTLRYPLCALPPQAVSFVPNYRNTAGSTSLSGSSQIISSAAGLWEAKLVSVALRGRATVVLWEAIEGLLEGRLNPIMIPIMEGLRQPYPASRQGGYGSIPHSDGSLFSDGSGYFQPVILATLRAAVARGAVTATIDVAFGRELQARDYFSLGERLYRIKTVEAVAGSVQTVKFWPPAREAAAEGDYLDFDRPACKMRLKSDTGMAIDKDMSRFASPTVEFIEDVS